MATATLARTLNYTKSVAKTLYLKRQCVTPALAILHNSDNSDTSVRHFSRTAVHRLKEISIKTENDTTVVEGIKIKTNCSEKLVDKLASIDNPKGLCPLCPKKLDYDIQYTDVMIISQFLQPDGEILSRQVTGLCGKAQSRLAKMVHQAKRAGLMPELKPDLPGGEITTSLESNYKWRKYNAYFENPVKYKS